MAAFSQAARGYALATKTNAKVAALRRTRFAVCCLLALSAPALAGRPLVTEDADVLAARDCELEAFAAHHREQGSVSLRGAALQFGCGIGWNSQGAVATAEWHAAGQRMRTLALVGKTGLAAPSDGSRWTLAWDLAGIDSGHGLRREGVALNSVLSWSLTASMRLHGNLVWSRSSALHASTTGWALALEHGAASRVALMAEAFADDRDRAPWVQFGARWAVQPERLFIDASFGTQTTAARPRRATVGMKVAF